MMTSYFQALGKAIKSLTITVLRNAALFIPRVIILNYIWKLNGVIAAQGKYVAATTRRRRRILPCRILFYNVSPNPSFLCLGMETSCILSIRPANTDIVIKEITPQRCGKPTRIAKQFLGSWPLGQLFFMFFVFAILCLPI